MKVLNMKVTLRASWCHSLKEKRMVVRSLVQRLKNKFNISVAEVGNQNLHQSIIIGISAVCTSTKQIDSTIESLINFIEENTDAEIMHIENEEYVF
ncbi:MAG: DUF503 domain-containing protein [Sarcina sp.]